MVWNHRICKKLALAAGEYRETVFSIHEAFYNSDKEIWAVTDNPVTVLTAEENLTDEEAIKNLRQTLEWMTKALSEPIIDMDTQVWAEMNPRKGARKGTRKSKTPDGSV